MEIEYLGRRLRETRQQSESAEKEGEEALLEKEKNNSNSKKNSWK